MNKKLLFLVTFFSCFGPANGASNEQQTLQQWLSWNEEALWFSGVSGGLAITEMASSMVDINRLKKVDRSALTRLQRAHDWIGGFFRVVLEAPIGDDITADNGYPGEVLHIPRNAPGFAAIMSRYAVTAADMITRLVTMKQFNLSSSQVKQYNKNVQELSAEQQAVFASRRRKMRVLVLMQMVAKFAAVASGVACSSSQYVHGRDGYYDYDTEAGATPALLGAGALGVASLSLIIYRLMYAKTVKNVLNKDEWVVNAKKAKATGDDFDDEDQNDKDNDNFDGDED